MVMQEQLCFHHF